MYRVLCLCAALHWSPGLSPWIRDGIEGTEQNISFRVALYMMSLFIYLFICIRHLYGGEGWKGRREGRDTKCRGHRLGQSDQYHLIGRVGSGSAHSA